MGFEFKIETGVGLTAPFESGTVCRAMYDALSSMQVNDSFVIENGQYTTFYFVRHIPEFESKKFTSRKEDNQHKRIWRIR